MACFPFPASGSWWVKGLPIMGSWHFLFLAHLSVSCLFFFLPSRNTYRSLICCWLCFPFFALLQFYSFLYFHFGGVLGRTGSSVHGILQVRMLEWVAVPFSKRSSWPRDQILVSRIAGRFFTSWVTREAQILGAMKSMANLVFLQNNL